MQQYASQQDYYGKSLADSVQTEQPFGAGLRVFDISQPAAPREIAFLAMPGFGAHRIWWVGGRYAYVSVHFEGFIDHIAGDHRCGGSRETRRSRDTGGCPACTAPAARTPPASFGKRTALHHMIIAGNLGYAAWRDGGFTVHDMSDPAQPKLISHRNYSPPFGGGAHTPLPLPDRNLLVLADEATSANCANGLAYTWIIDVREPSNPVSIATLPTPGEEDFCAKGAKFGPHNLHENRPGSLQSEDIDLRHLSQCGPEDFRHAQCHSSRSKSATFVPPPPEQIVDQRPNPAKVIQSCDVFVDDERRDVSHRHQCRALHPAIRRH